MAGNRISTPAGTEGYAAIRDGAAIGALEARAPLGISGGDRASYLQGLLTNDIGSLGPGAGCYAAWLTPQGRLLTDLHVFESGDMMLLDVPAAQAGPTLERLDQFLFSEDVQLADLSTALASVWLHGPEAASTLERVLTGASGLSAWPGYHNARAVFDGAPAVVGRVNQLGVPGFVVYVEPARTAALTAALVSAGAVAASPAALEAARIEVAYPLAGVDMDENTLPLEAGIEPRAISFTKGCYVGQEVIIRVLHRGHGRVARRLVLLHVSGGVPAAGSAIVDGDREIGAVTSAARSPRFGPIALGYVHRDYVDDGTRVGIAADGGSLEAVVAGRSGGEASGPTAS
jgi:folate-binding protein YgfZ